MPQANISDELIRHTVINFLIVFLRHAEYLLIAAVPFLVAVFNYITQFHIAHRPLVMRRSVKTLCKINPAPPATLQVELD